MASRSTTSSVTSRPQVERRGFSLLELLLALGLVLAIAAVAAPLTYREFTRNESVAALDRLAMQSVLARVEARQTGLPHELMVDETGRRLTVRSVDPRNPGMITPAEDALDNPEFGMDGMLLDDETPVIPAESWQLLVLPEGMRLEPYAAESERFTFDEIDEGVMEFGMDDLVEDMDPFSAPARLAMFMPDGSLLGVRPMVMVRAEGRDRILLDPWTGRMMLEPLRNEQLEETTRDEPAEDQLIGEDVPVERSQ